MMQPATRPSYDPNRLLDALMKRLGMASDKALSQKLNIACKVIRKIREGVLPIRASMLLWMSEVSGMNVAELRGILGDQRSSFRLVAGAGSA